MTMISRILLVILSATAAFGQGRSPADLLKLNVPADGKHITYGSDPLEFGELRLPSGRGPHPVAVIVHGGCWSAKLGNLDDRAVALDLLRPMAAALTAAGIATWNLE